MIFTKNVSMNIYIILLFTRLTTSYVFGVSPRQTEDQPLLTHSPLPDLNVTPLEDHDNAQGHAGKPEVRPVNTLESVGHTSPVSTQFITEDDLKKERRIALRRKNAKKLYAALPPERKIARSRQVLLNHKARFATWSEEKKEEYRIKQKEAKLKSLQNPTPRPYVRRKGKHDIGNQGDSQSTVKTSAIINLSEMPSSEPENNQHSPTRRKRKQDAAGLAEHNPAQTEAMDSSKRMRIPTYHRMTKEGKQERNHRVYVNHRAQYDSWPEAKKKEYRDRKRDIQRKYLSNKRQKIQNSNSRMDSR